MQYLGHHLVPELVAGPARATFELVDLDFGIRPGDVAERTLRGDLAHPVYRPDVVQVHHRRRQSSVQTENRPFDQLLTHTITDLGNTAAMGM
ncbi:MAG: hypothetical protein P4M11_01255 [Candidatus Pacebacteria bacterium]|nr:hypothetical protein [Candidatus Paceibacterota bacterium]